MEQQEREVDILENNIYKKYPEVLSILLCDQTTKKNIFWATDNYQDLGNYYKFSSPIKIDSITGLNGKVIMPRILKNKILQKTRVKDMAEVYTPAWVCNAQNNLIDNAWFQKENVFNIEVEKHDGYGWKVNPKKIIFPKDKTWKHYIEDKRLEIACGEAPYITSRYDITTGRFIPIEKRIGILDRKLRVINENVDTSGEWLKASQIAFESTYAYEWQGDSLLLAREALLRTFIENYILKFNKEPPLRSIKNIAFIISWNVWQMDGLKCTIPNSCKEENIKYCLIKEWAIKSKKSRDIKFIELIQK